MWWVQTTCFSLLFTMTLNKIPGDLQGDIPEDATLSESGGGDVHKNHWKTIEPPQTKIIWLNGASIYFCRYHKMIPRDSVNCGEVHGFIIIVSMIFSGRCTAIKAAPAAKGIWKKQLLLFRCSKSAMPGACALLANCGFLCPCKPKAVIPQYRQVVWVSAEGVATA